ncbi:hypothetical protein AT430_004261, partial [Escherichia coli]
FYQAARTPPRIDHYPTGDAAHEAAVAANVAMLMRLHGHEDLQANAQTVLEVLRSGSAYDRVTALAARG